MSEQGSKEYIGDAVYVRVDQFGDLVLGALPSSSRADRELALLAVASGGRMMRMDEETELALALLDLLAEEEPR